MKEHTHLSTLELLSLLLYILWSEHIHNICTKARKAIGILYHHFYLNADTNSLLQLYLSLARPILDYACQVWHPDLIKDIQKLESVQKFALRLCTKQWNLDYESLLMICNILTLTARRKFFCLCTMFKIIYKLIYFPHNIFEPRVTTLHPASDLLLSQPFAHTNSFVFSFVPFTCMELSPIIF